MKVQAELESESKKITYLGHHILAEFYGCCPNVLNNVGLIEQYMNEAAIKCGATVVATKFHMFNPYGVSGVVIISESHLTIHTWPELGYAAVDLFTCGDTCKPEIAYEYLMKELQAESGSFSELKRGMFDSTNNQVLETPFQVTKQI